MKLNVINAPVWQALFAQIDLKDAILSIVDGSVTPNSIDVKIGEGNLTYTERVNREYTLDRGLLDEVRNGDEVPVEVRFDFVWDYITGNGTATIEDALKQTGDASGWTSTDADTCRPYAVDLVLVYTPTPSTCGDMETITLSDFRYEQLDHDLRAGTISATGRCNVTEAGVVRAAQP